MKDRLDTITYKSFSNRVQFALDNFMAHDYISCGNDNEIKLTEDDEAGKSLLLVKNSSSEILTVENFDKKHRCGFLRLDKKIGMHKACDHVIFKSVCNLHNDLSQQSNDINYNNCFNVSDASNWVLYIIEMKTTIGMMTLDDIYQKVRSSFLNAKSLALFLGINIADVKVVVTYEIDKCLNDIPLFINKSQLSPGINRYNINNGYNWSNNRISINIGLSQRINFPVLKINMKRNHRTGVLEGVLLI